jgi:hypothetical protein
MANLSELTRREQVLKYLQDHAGQWVDGPDLATEAVGGSEGLRRLRELREEGQHDIRRRMHPDRSRGTFQYKLVPKAAVFDVVKASKGEQPWSPVPGPPEPADTYDYRPPDKPRGTHLGRTQSGEFVVVYDGPPPLVDDEQQVILIAEGQVDLGVPEEPTFKYTEMPKALDMGKHRRCPLCQGYRRPIFEKDPVSGRKIVPAVGAKPKIVAYEDHCRDPRKGKKGAPCERCNGFGVVPA